MSTLSGALNCIGFLRRHCRENRERKTQVQAERYIAAMLPLFPEMPLIVHHPVPMLVPIDEAKQLFAAADVTKGAVRDMIIAAFVERWRIPDNTYVQFGRCFGSGVAQSA